MACLSAASRRPTSKSGRPSVPSPIGRKKSEERSTRSSSASGQTSGQKLPTRAPSRLDIPHWRRARPSPAFWTSVTAVAMSLSLWEKTTAKLWVG